MRFAGRIAMVTGASRGVGKTLALRLAAEGCDVVVAAKTAAPDPRLPGTIHDTAREIEALGRRAFAAQLDVRDDAAVERVVAEAHARFGAIDFLVNNAGALYWRAAAETEMKRFDLVMGVNARGTLACTRYVLPSMLARKFGHILMLSPPVDPTAGAGKVAYALSKFGMTLIAQGVAEELRGQGVAANALWPATLIDSQATRRWGLGGPALWRKPEILADAMVAIFDKPPDSFTGQALIDEDFLRGEGVTDFARYRCEPDSEPPRVGFDFRLQAG
ncbi:MAG TPA: SDR family oxidoreductase [Polyangia bacterium]|nr:SDR family oxidoreductase [Polyangia bacterium]